jgi:hypothetical protein
MCKSIVVFLLAALAAIPSTSSGVDLDTVNWAPSNTPSGTGTGVLGGTNVVTYTTDFGFNSGETFPYDWPNQLGTAAATSVTFQLGGVLTGSTTGTLETITFGAPVVSPVLLVNFLGGPLGFSDDVFQFGGNSFTLLSAFNAIQTVSGMAATPATTDSADDGFAIQFGGTFGPTNPLVFTYSSDGFHAGLESVGFTIGTALVPEPSSLVLAAFGLAGLAAWSTIHSVCRPSREDR